MKSLLKSPFVNAICVSLFSAFYTVVYILAGRPLYVGLPMIALTVIIVVMLLSRRRRYDEFHAFIMANCLIAALVLTMLSIAAFYLLILHDPTDIGKKFAYFIDTHWVTVVLSDFVYVLLCRRR